MLFKNQNQLLSDLHEKMFLIRAVEERSKEEYASRRIRGPVHLSIGQEAAAVGVLHACLQSDVCVSTHRNHAHYLAKGGSLDGMVDELFGLDSGCCKGFGGSMHGGTNHNSRAHQNNVLNNVLPFQRGCVWNLCKGFAGEED